MFFVPEYVWNKKNKCNNRAGRSFADRGKRIIAIPKSSKDEMFDQMKKEFLRENGVLNGDATKRLDVYTNMYQKVKKNDRLAAGYTVGRYERQYCQAFLLL